MANGTAFRRLQAGAAARAWDLAAALPTVSDALPAVIDVRKQVNVRTLQRQASKLQRGAKGLYRERVFYSLKLLILLCIKIGERACRVAFPRSEADASGVTNYG